MPAGLAGDFATMPMQDLVFYLGNRRLSGLLTLWQEARKKSAVIYEGQVVSTSSADPREYLSQFLINFGHLTEDQLDKAMKAQAESKIHLGRILTMVGQVPEETIRTVLTIKARETLLEVLRWSAGQFTFEPGPPPENMDGIEAPVALVDIHREGEFRETAWQAIRQAFPTGEATVRLDEARLSKEQVQPGSMDEKLLEAIREGQTIDEMVFSLHTIDFHLYQRLYALYRQGAVAPGPTRSRPAAPQAVIGEETPIGGLLGHAEEFVASGRFAEAEVLCLRIRELAPSPAAQDLLKKAEAGLHEALRAQLLGRSVVPELAVEASRIRGPDLTPPEKYLLSRIDGTRDVQSIVKVAPLRELEALKYLQRFLESGLIRLRG